LVTFLFTGMQPSAWQGKNTPGARGGGARGGNSQSARATTHHHHSTSSLSVSFNENTDESGRQSRTGGRKVYYNSRHTSASRSPARVPPEPQPKRRQSHSYGPGLASGSSSSAIPSGSGPSGSNQSTISRLVPPARLSAPGYKIP